MAQCRAAPRQSRGTPHSNSPAKSAHSEMKTIVYVKSGLPWAGVVVDCLKELSVPFEVRNISTNDEFAQEVERKSGQSKSPTLDIDGKILPDASVDDVAEHLETLGWKV